MPVTINMPSLWVAYISHKHGSAWFSAPTYDLLMKTISEDYCAEWWADVEGHCGFGDDEVGTYAQTLAEVGGDHSKVVDVYFETHETEWMDCLEVGGPA